MIKADRIAPGKRTAERYRKAKELVNQVREMALVEPDYRSFAKAWAMIYHGLQRALDYDVKLFPPDAMMAYTESLAKEIREALEAILGSPMSDSSWQQATLPGQHGGLGLRIGQAKPWMAATYWSSYDLHRTVVPALLGSLKSPATDRDPEAAHAEQANKYM